MANERLGEKNIERLLNEYRSERRRLMFQLNKVRETIAELKAARADQEKSDQKLTAPGVKRGPGRPRKDAAPVPAPKKRRKKRVVAAGGYRLSKWDEMVLGTITKADKLLPKEDLMKAALAWAKKSQPRMTEPEVEAKLTRVLQKLSGKRGDLGTHRSGLRRGYHYGLKDWFFTTSGKLRGQHMDKLVLK
ncbi:MAG: hypothetical protein R2818_02480 [Flavobacteriales bacterium]